jgi:hypothetical protein
MLLPDKKNSLIGALIFKYTKVEYITNPLKRNSNQDTEYSYINPPRITFTGSTVLGLYLRILGKFIQPEQWNEIVLSNQDHAETDSFTRSVVVSWNDELFIDTATVELIEEWLKEPTWKSIVLKIYVS